MNMPYGQLPPYSGGKDFFAMDNLLEDFELGPLELDLIPGPFGSDDNSDVMLWGGISVFALVFGYLILAR